MALPLVHSPEIDELDKLGFTLPRDAVLPMSGFPCYGDRIVEHLMGIGGATTHSRLAWAIRTNAKIIDTFRCVSSWETPVALIGPWKPLRSGLSIPNNDKPSLTGFVVLKGEVLLGNTVVKPWQYCVVRRGSLTPITSDTIIMPLGYLDRDTQTPLRLGKLVKTFEKGESSSFPEYKCPVTTQSPCDFPPTWLIYDLVGYPRQK